MWVCVFVEHARDTPLESIVHPQTLFTVAGIASLAATVSFSGSVYQLRSDVLVGEDPSHQDVVAMFSCTWPCVVLRGASACAFGAGLLAVVFVCRSLLVGLENARQCWSCHQQNVCSVCFNLGHGIFTASVFAGSFLEGYYGYPLEMPVEDLVTGPAFWVFLIVPCWNTICFCSGWKCLVWASSPRVRMLSRLYRIHTWVAIFAFVGSSWLLYVLRESTVDPERHQMPLHIKSVLWQAAGIPYVSNALLLWSWGTERAEQRRRAKWIYLRTLLVWTPAAVWPLMVAAIADDVSGYLDTKWLRVAALCLGVSLGGFLYELTSFILFRYQLARATWKVAFPVILVCGFLVSCANYAAAR